MSIVLLDEVIINNQIFKRNSPPIGQGTFGIIYKYERDNDIVLGNIYNNLDMLRPLGKAKEIIIKYEKKDNKGDIGAIKDTKNILNILKNGKCGEHFSNFGIYTHNEKNIL